MYWISKLEDFGFPSLWRTCNCLISVRGVSYFQTASPSCSRHVWKFRVLVASYRVVQYTLEAANRSPTTDYWRRQEKKGDALRSVSHTQSQTRTSEGKVVTITTSKDLTRPQADVVQSQNHPVIPYNALLGHFITTSHRSTQRSSPEGSLVHALDHSHLGPWQ